MLEKTENKQEKWLWTAHSLNWLTDCHFRKGDSGVAELGEGEDEVVAEEEQEGSGDEQAPAEFVINSKLSVQHEVQIVEERRKT